MSEGFVSNMLPKPSYCPPAIKVHVYHVPYTWLLSTFCKYSCLPFYLYLVIVQMLQWFISTILPEPVQLVKGIMPTMSTTAVNVHLLQGYKSTMLSAPVNCPHATKIHVHHFPCTCYQSTCCRGPEVHLSPAQLAGLFPSLPEPGEWQGDQQVTLNQNISFTTSFCLSRCIMAPSLS